MSDNWYEAEIAEGLEDIAFDELRNKHTIHKPKRLRGAVKFTYADDLRNLANLQTVNSVYRLLEYDIPRPRALLGHEHFHRLLNSISDIRTTDHTSFYVSAAGSDSSVMQRIKADLAKHTGLEEVDENGDLLIRIRRRKPGWDVLIRLTPRPLATRDWRICNFEGALNGPTAHAMSVISNPDPNDRVLNLACGSGTLMIERMRQCAPNHIYGLDNDNDALNCARTNLQAADTAPEQFTLIEADIHDIPLPSNSIDVIYADLPFGQLVGSHEENLALYPSTLEEAGRVAIPGARFIVITHEVRLMDDLLRKHTQWRVERVTRVSLRGLHPRIYCLHKR